MFCWVFVASLASADPIVICHPNLKNEDLSNQLLLRIYAMQKRVWSDNTPVRVYTFSNDNKVHKDFVNTFLRMQPYQLDRLWHRLVFSGTGKPPEVVASIKEMMDVVRTQPGSIGYIDSRYLDESDKSLMVVTKSE